MPKLTLTVVVVLVLVAYLWWSSRPAGSSSLPFSPLLSTRDETPGTLLNPSPGATYRGIDFNAPVT